MYGNSRLLRLVVVVTLVVSATGMATTAAGVEAETPDTAAVATTDPALEVASGVAADDRGAVSPARDDGAGYADVDIDVEEPQSSNDFLSAFRTLSGQESLAAYSEFEVIRTQAIIEVQSGSFEDADRQRMRAVLRTLVQFDRAYAAAENGSLTESLQSAQATRETLSSLESDGTVYRSLAGVALDRFFRSLGDRFEARSRGNISTPAQIDALQQAGEAYRLGGSSDRFAEVSVRAEQLQSSYARDRRQINESVASAQRFFDRCGDACGGPISAVTTHATAVFGLYSDARTASAETSEAVRLAETHNLGEETQEIQALADESSSMLLSLALGSALLFLAYALILAVPTVLIASRISLWAQDRRAAAVGSVLTPMPTEVRADGGE